MLAIFVFGLQIFVHELGHFVTARIFRVTVNEFALGMGPAIIKKKVKQTQYSIRLLPIGGYCAMEGEDEESSAEGAFNRKPVWQRCIIISAGAIMNFISGFLIIVILMMPVTQYATPEIAAFDEGFPYRGEAMLMENDRILKINGYRIYTNQDVSLFLSHGIGKPYDILVERGGQKVLIRDLQLKQHEYMTEVQTESGTEVVPMLRYGLKFKTRSAGFFDKLRLSWYNAINFVRLVKVSLFDLLSGKAKLSELSGPVGITSALTETAKTSMSGMWMFVALIAVNLSVLNLLPLPALDGGRIIFLLVELIRRKPINPKYEGYVHLVGLALFMVLMVYVAYNDILRLISQ
ncbi:MAG: M50 family metallopeptidase [Eubacteriales bacterium]